jgi:CRISPR/Cas system CSM-associated protein Csm5 (group 7 of RAMP superfamily)
LLSAKRHLRINIEYVPLEALIMSAELWYVKLEDNKADILTKPLETKQYQKLRKMLKITTNDALFVGGGG